MLLTSGLSRAQDISIDPRQPFGTTYCRQASFIAPNFTMVASGTITAMKVSFSSGYIQGEDELRLVDYAGSVKAIWSAYQGFLTLSGGTGINDYIQAIRQIKYFNNAIVPTVSDRYITFSLDDADYLPATQHFYKFISKAGITWSSARAEAESTGMKYHGLQGYLATITSDAENTFIQQKTQGVGWIGASDAAFEGDWKWVTGPEGRENNGQGRLFWRGTGYQAKTNTANYGPVNNEYHNWNRWSVPYSATLATTSWEPNNSGDEDYAHITFFPTNPSESLRWNDLSNTGGASGTYMPAGYLVEYGGMQGDPVVNLTATIALYVKTVSFASSIPLTRCQGDPVQLNQPETKATYLWSPATGLSNPAISNPLAKPDVSTQYTVRGVNGSCSDSAKFMVNINPAPVSQLKEEENICAGKMVLLDPGAHSAYSWSNGSTTKTVLTGIAGKYVVKLTSDKGCTAKDSVLVAVQTYPKMNLTGLKTLVCGSKAVTLNISKDKGEWLITNLTTKQKFTTPSIQVGAYSTFPFQINLTDPFGCGVDTFLTIGFRENPTLQLGNDTTICKPSKLLLDAGSTANTYQWSSGETIPKLLVSSPGTFRVLARNSYGCTTSDSIQVAFTNKPKLDLSGFVPLICGSMAATVNIKADKGTYQFTSKNPSVKINGLNTNVPIFGNYPYTFSSVDQYGCTSDTSFILGFHKIPTVKFTIDESECYGYNLQATYIGDAVISNTRFTWVFAGDTISNKMGQHIETIPLGVGQAKRDLSLTVNEEGCTNDDAIKDIHVIPTLSMDVGKSVQCQPVAFEFSGSNTETGVKYLWELGDGSTASTKQVTHQYAKAGYFDVSLTVTTDKGCTNTKTIKEMVYAAPIPTAGFSLKPGECLNQGKDTVSYIGSASAVDTYRWNLGEFDPIEIIQSPDTTAGPFVFELIKKPKAKITLFVVSSYGCQSATASLEVKRKPLFSFESSAMDGCAPFLVNYKAKADDPVDQLAFKWEFGDKEIGEGAVLDHNYLTPNWTYDLRLSAVSSTTGCTDSIFKAKYIAVHPNPTAGFTMDHDIVYNDMPKVTFADQSVDAINYYWDFGDGLHSREKDPVHSYEVVGKRKILQTVYNEFDCQDTTSNFVMVAFNRIFAPNAIAPNAAAAIDRQFILSSEGIKKEGYHLTILSRWNDKVFECKNEIKGWDGRMTNGNFAPAGNYIWILECFDFLGRPHRQTGWLTLVF